MDAACLKLGADMRPEASPCSAPAATALSGKSKNRFGR